MAEELHALVEVEARSKPTPAVVISFRLPEGIHVEAEGRVRFPFPPAQARELAEMIFGAADGLDQAHRLLDQ